MKLVIDASVSVKWFFPDPETESHAEAAIALLQALGNGAVSALQPPHWLAEVIAVVSRIRPEVGETAAELLDAMEFSQEADLDVYRRAVRLAIDLDHHLFDTLYHALALEHGAFLVTADERYYRKACALGGIVTLADWAENETVR